MLVNSSFSRDQSRKRHEKRAAGRSFLHNLITLASIVRTATLNMQLGALRDQQRLWENCFLQMFLRRRLWKDAAPLKRHKQPNVRARRARLGSKRGCHGAGWCLPPRARSLEPSAAKCSKRDGACEVGRSAYAPTHAPGGARATSPGVYVRRPPGALVPTAPCAHAAAWPCAGTRKLWGALEGAGAKTVQAATYETQAPSSGV